MTEETARTKWCPMTRQVVGTITDELTTVSGYGGHNKVVQNGESFDFTGCLCIASDCMMWKTMVYGDDQKPLGGYCGLAGKL